MIRPPLSDSQNRMMGGLSKQATLPTFSQGSVAFNGVDNYLILSDQSMDSVTTNLTLIIAFRPRARARGWVVSNNNLFSGPPKGPVGFGIHLDETGLLRPLVGSENRFAANKLVSPGQMHIVSLAASPSLYRMWINSTLAFDKQNFTGSQPRSSGPRSATRDPFAASEEILKSSRPFTLAVGGTPGQQDDFFQGSVAEVLVFSEVLSDIARSQAERALCLRWQGCVPNSGQISFKVLQASVNNNRQYYNVELQRQGGADGVVQVSYKMGFESALSGEDYYSAEGAVTWEHGDYAPKYVPVRILDNLAVPRPSRMVGVQLSLRCATYPSSVTITTDRFKLTINSVATPRWQSLPSLDLGLSLGGGVFTFKASGITSDVTAYGCEYASPLPTAQCACESDGSCKFTQTKHCPLTEAVCSATSPAVHVDQEAGTVTCSTPKWKCPGSIAAVQLLRKGTANDVVCRPAAGVNSSIGVNFQEDPVFFTYREDCFVPDWVRVPLDTSTGSTDDLKFAYFSEPTITSISPRQGPTAGRGSVTLYGLNFSDTAIDPVVRVGMTDCVSSEWVSSTSIVCTNMSSGNGPNLNVSLLTLGGDVRAVASMAFSYELPRVTAVTPNRTRRAGNVLITVHGRNFGMIPPEGGVTDASVNMSKGRGTSEPLMTGGCTGATWTSDTSITCLATAGIGAASVSVVRVGKNYIGTTRHALNEEPFEYDPANLTSIKVASVLFPRGGNIITLYGNEFGHYRGEKQLFLSVGNTDTDTVRWTSDSAVQAVTPAGAGRQVKVRVRINGQNTDSKQNVTYPPITVTSVTPLGGAARGGNSITVQGTNFGPGLEENLGQTIKIGPNACPKLQYLSETELVCETPGGVGTSLNVDVHINGYTTGLSGVFSYDPPRASLVTPYSHPSNISTVTTLTITGQNFGPKDSTPQASIGVTSCGRTKWVSDASILCIGAAGGDSLAPMRGFGSVPVSVTVAGQQTNEQRTVNFVYTRPTLSSITPSDSPAAGGVTVTVLGSNFGQSSYSSFVTMEFGGTPCASTTWVSDSRIDCVTPQASFNPPELFTQSDGFVQAVVSVAGARSPSQGLNFRFLPLPIIHNLKPANAPAVGGTVITLEGQGFGMQLDNLVVGINSVECLQTAWISRNFVTCKVPPGVGKSRAVSVQVSTLNSMMQNTKAGAFKYDEPEVHAFIYNGSSIYNVPTLGNIQVTVRGKNFGVTNQQMQARVLVGETPCIQTSWVSDSGLICRTPQGHGASRKVQVNIACGQSHPPNAPLLSCTVSNQTYNVVYDAPVLTVARISPSNITAAGAGNETLQLIGKNYGAADPGWSITIGPTSVSSIMWTSDSSIRCMTAGGVGTNNIRMNYSGVESVFSRAFTYSTPLVLSATPSSGLSTGGDTITINGRNFASMKHNVTVQIGSTACQTSTWVSDTAITCVTSPGAYIDLTVKVKIDQSYEPVVINGEGKRIFSYSSGSCDEILKYEPDSPSAEYMINPTAIDEFSKSAFAIYCRMGRAQAAPGGLGSLEKDPIIWLDAADDSYFVYQMYSDNQTSLAEVSTTEVYVPGRGWGPTYTSSGKYRSPVAMWRSRLGNYSFTQETPGRRPMYVANDETLTFRMGQPPGAPYGLDYVHPGVMRFDGFDDFLVSNVPRSTSGALSILMVAGKTLSTQGGWAMSDVSINAAQKRVDGAGILFEPEGFVRPVGSSETRYSSVANVNVSLHVVTFRASAELFTLHIDSNLAAGVDKYACTGGSSGQNNGTVCTGAQDATSCETSATMPMPANLKLWLDASTIGPSDRAEMLPDGSLNPSIVTWSSVPAPDATLSSVTANPEGAHNPQYVKGAVNRIWPAVRVGAGMYGPISTAVTTASGVTIVAVIKNANASAKSPGVFLFGGITCLATAKVRINGAAVAEDGYAAAGQWADFAVVSIVGSGDCGSLTYLGSESVATDNNTWAGEIAEVMVWDAELTGPNLYAAEDYVRFKYNVGPALCARTGMPQLDPAAGQSLYLGTYPDALKRIISRSGKSGFFGGDIAEMIIFDHVISDKQRAAMERALCLRWLKGCASVFTTLTLSGISSETFNTDMATLIVENMARLLGLPVSQVRIDSVADQAAAAVRRRAMRRRLLEANPEFEGYADSLSLNLVVVISSLSETEAITVTQSVTTMINNGTLLVSLRTIEQLADSNLVFAPGGEPFMDGLVYNGNVTFATSAKVVGESIGKVPVTVRRVGGSDGVIIVEWRTLNASAMGGRDFVGASGKIMWNHSDTDDKTVYVEILDDDTREDDMEFMVEITPFYSEFLGQFAVLGPNKMSVTIKDNTIPTAPYWKQIKATQASVTSPDSGPVAGGFLITIEGANFETGSTGYKCEWYQPSVAGGLFDSACTDCSRQALNSNVTVQSDTSLVCKVPQWDRTSNFDVYMRLSKDGQGIDRVGGRTPFVFLEPKPTRIATPSGSVVVRASGVASFNIEGTSFGFSQAPISVYLGTKQATTVTWVNDTLISVSSFGIPGTGMFLNLKVSIFGRNATLTGKVSYMPPNVSAIVPATGASMFGASSKVTVQGSDFGPGDEAPVVTIGSSTCTDVETVSDSQLVCISDVQSTATLADAGTSVHVTVSVGGQASSGGVTWRYRPLQTVTQVSPSSGGVLSSSARVVSIIGQNFGTSNGSPIAYLGDTACTSTQWVSDTQVACSSTGIAGWDALPARVEVSPYGKSSSSVLFNFNPPVIASVTGNVDSGGSITVAGSNFGPSDKSLACVIGELSTTSRWVSDSSIVCPSPMRAGPNSASLQIGIGTHQSITESKFISNAGACITSFTSEIPTAVPKKGGTITVIGRNFGSVGQPTNPAADGRVRIVGSSGTCGRVEVQWKGYFGTVRTDCAACTLLNQISALFPCGHSRTCNMCFPQTYCIRHRK
jgi:hypothetical protein